MPTFAETYPYRKTYVPLESNPLVFTELIYKLGVSDDLEVQDVYSLDDADLLAITPRPVYALIFTLVITDKYISWRESEEENRTYYSGKGEGEDVIWFQQSIRNTCGFIGILHSISNGPAASHITPNSALGRLLKEVIPLDRNARALVIEGSKEIEEAYSVAAQKGDTAPPEVGEKVNDYHYIAFVPNKTNDKIYLMDGTSKGPVYTGVELKEGDDFLLKAVQVVKDITSHIDGGVMFSLMALVDTGH